MLNSIKKLASVPTAIQLLSSSAAQCLLFMYASRGTTTHIQIIMCAMHYIISNSLSLVPCVFGNLLIDAGTELERAIYECNWCDQSLRFQQDLKFFLARAQKENGIKAAEWISIDLRTFVQSQKLAYSFFTFLQST